MSLGDLYAMVMGQKQGNAINEANKARDAGIEDDKRWGIENKLKQDTLLRQHPLLTETSNQLEQVRGQGGNALDDLLLNAGRDTPALNQANIAEKSSLADYYKNHAGILGADLPTEAPLRESEIFKNLQVKQAATNANKKEDDTKKQGFGLLQTIDNLQSTLKQIPPGILPAIGGPLQQFEASKGFGTNKAAIAKFHSLAGGTQMQFGKDFSGRYNNEEGKMIGEKILPAINLPEDQRAAALDGARQLVYAKFGITPDDYQGFQSSQPRQSSAAPRAPNPQPRPGNAPAVAPSNSAPSGATHIVMGSDGQKHYTDGKNDLGVAK